MFQSAIQLERQLSAASSSPLELAVVVPTLNEYANIAEFLSLLEVALVGIEWEAVFVDDDSKDGTADLLREIGREDRRVKVIHRIGRRGLASAVVEGALASSAPLIAVMDADLQHDHGCLPRLVEAVRDGSDLAVGSRYVDGGGVGEWDRARHNGSLWATRLAQKVLKAPLNDPMSGFFCISREKFMASLPRLSGGGFKILLDIVSSAPVPLTVAEIPYVFRVRTAGESKLDFMVVAEYAKLLLDKSVGRVVPVSLLMFLAVGALGVVVHLAVLGTLLNGLGVGFALSQAAAVALAMTFNFSLNNTFTYSDRRLRGWRFAKGLAGFAAVCSVGAAANVGVGSYIYASEPNWWLAGIAGSLIGAVWNYVASSALVWRR
jgi:dolichol-phosphate mannosyltransferase